MASKQKLSNTHVRTKKGQMKFVGGSEMARRAAVRKATRIIRPGEKERSAETVPSSLSPFEYFFAGLLRSEATEFVGKSGDCWKKVCKRLRLPVPDGPIRSYYNNKKVHFAFRAALVLEEARYSISSGLLSLNNKLLAMNRNSSSSGRKHNQRNRNHRNRGNEDVLQVSLVNLEVKTKTGHTFLTFGFKRDGPILPHELLHLRHGTVFACFSQSLSRTVENSYLACILPGSRDEIIESKSFQVVVFKPLKKSSGEMWDLFPITSLISEQRKFEACTASTTASVPFLHSLLGGKAATHTRFEDNIEVESVSKKSSSVQESNQIPDYSDTSPVLHKEMGTLFEVPSLNNTQEKAASLFLNSPSNTITLVQGPPGTGKTTLLVSIICRYLVQSIKEEKSRCMLVCAPTNKAVSVLCTRFLDSMKGDNFPCNVVLVGDDDKLLDDDQSRTQYGKESSKLRSVFMYTWTKTVMDDYDKIRTYLIGNYRKDGERICRLSRRLEGRIKHSVSGVDQALLKIMSDLTIWLEQDTASKGCGDKKRALELVDYVIKSIREWKKEEIWCELLGSAHIVFCTLASAGASVIKRNVVQIDDLIVDEAAASTEPEMYIPFQYKPLRLLAVGDPKQLPATVVSPKAEEYGLSKSLHERLMYDCKLGHVMLDIQYRMKPDICQFPSQRFYDDRLGNGPNVLSSQYDSQVKLVDGAPYSFLHVDGNERQGFSGSYENQAEANVIGDLVHRLQKLSYRVRSAGKWHSADRIRIITFYQAQVTLIKRVLARRRMRDVVVATVDSSQGCEADIVIVSFVRSRGNKKSVGFLTDNRRMNVAITRAKYQLVCVGNVGGMTSLTNSKAATVKALAVDAVERGCTKGYSVSRDNRSRVPSEKECSEKSDKKRKRDQPKESPVISVENIKARQVESKAAAVPKTSRMKKHPKHSSKEPKLASASEKLPPAKISIKNEKSSIKNENSPIKNEKLVATPVKLEPSKTVIEICSDDEKNVDLISIASGDSDTVDGRCAIADSERNKTTPPVEIRKDQSVHDIVEIDSAGRSLRKESLASSFEEDDSHRPRKRLKAEDIINDRNSDSTGACSGAIDGFGTTFASDVDILSRQKKIVEKRGQGSSNIEVEVGALPEDDSMFCEIDI